MIGDHQTDVGEYSNMSEKNQDFGLHVLWIKTGAGFGETDMPQKKTDMSYE